MKLLSEYASVLLIDHMDIVKEYSKRQNEF